MWTLPRTLRNIKGHYPRRFLGDVQRPIISEVAGKNEAASWLNQGFSSAKIADRMGVSVETVIAYPYNQVGERRIALSTSWSRSMRKLEKPLKRSSVNEGSIAESEGRRAIRDRYPDVHFF